ncbi:MAG: hypothetical protein CMM07_24645 [Rhodopirellula sp.]|nr:hypothetical protein [Rhodopirellula sp.]
MINRQDTFALHKRPPLNMAEPHAVRGQQCKIEAGKKLPRVGERKPLLTNQRYGVSKKTEF